MNREDIIRCAREAGFELKNRDELPLLERFAELVAADERELRAQQTQNCETIERQKHAIREAMYLLDQPEPRVHAAFSELLCALNPKLREIKENIDERTNP